MSYLIEYAKRELDLIGFKSGNLEPEKKIMRRHILKIIETFLSEPSIGVYATSVIQMLGHLLIAKPLSPLNGDDSEWDRVGRNNRYMNVIKDENGDCWDECARLFRDPSGRVHIQPESKVKISFPYVPRVEYIDVPFIEGDKLNG